MTALIVPLAILSLVVINYPILKAVVQYKDKKQIGLNNPLQVIRGDTCYNSKEQLCPMRTYKQCTNNNPPISKCDCHERSFELCPKHLQYHEKNFMNEYREMPDLVVYPKFPSTHMRVNHYRSDNTGYNHNIPGERLIEKENIRSENKYLNRNELYSQHPSC